MPALSTHLGILRDAGLIVERREAAQALLAHNANGMNSLFELVDAFWAYLPHNLKRYFKCRAKRE